MIESNGLSEVENVDIIKYVNRNPLSAVEKERIVEVAIDFLVHLNSNQHNLRASSSSNGRISSELEDIFNRVEQLSNFDFHKRMANVFRSRHDFSVSYYCEEEMGYSYASLGFSINEYFTNDHTRRYIISEIYDKTLESELAVGSEVITVDEKPVHEYAMEQSKYTTYSNDTSQLQEGLKLITERISAVSQLRTHQPVRIQYQTESERSKSIVFKWKYYMRDTEENRSEADSRLCEMRTNAAHNSKFGEHYIQRYVEPNSKDDSFNQMEPSFSERENEQGSTEPNYGFTDDENNSNHEQSCSPIFRQTQKCTDDYIYRKGIFENPYIYKRDMNNFILKLIESSILRSVIKVDPLYFKGIASIMKCQSITFGYLKILDFQQLWTPRLMIEMNQLLKDLFDEGMEELVVDVRGNPGGNLESVRAFIECLGDQSGFSLYKQRNASKRILELKNKIGKAHLSMIEQIEIGEAVEAGEVHSAPIQLTYKRKYNQIWDKPITVLTDVRTRGAAEIFASLVIDYDIGRVIGIHPTTAGSAFEQLTTFTEEDRDNENSSEKSRWDLPRSIEMCVPLDAVYRTRSAGGPCCRKCTPKNGPKRSRQIAYLGVQPHYRYFVSRDDILDFDVDLFHYIASFYLHQSSSDIQILDFLPSIAQTNYDEGSDDDTPLETESKRTSNSNHAIVKYEDYKVKEGWKAPQIE